MDWGFGGRRPWKCVVSGGRCRKGHLLPIPHPHPCPYPPTHHQVLLMDEITVDMDVLGRQDLLEFFKSECDSRGATIVYATHIFDGLEGWVTHMAYLEDGEMKIGESGFLVRGAENGGVGGGVDLSSCQAGSLVWFMLTHYSASSHIFDGLEGWVTG